MAVDKIQQETCFITLGDKSVYYKWCDTLGLCQNDIFYYLAILETV